MSVVYIAEEAMHTHICINLSICEPLNNSAFVVHGRVMSKMKLRETSNQISFWPDFVCDHICQHVINEKVKFPITIIIITPHFLSHCYISIYITSIH